ARICSNKGRHAVGVRDPAERPTDGPTLNYLIWVMPAKGRASHRQATLRTDRSQPNSLESGLRVLGQDPCLRDALAHTAGVRGLMQPVLKQARAFGIDPVQVEHRVLGLADSFVLWADLLVVLRRGVQAARTASA